MGGDRPWLLGILIYEEVMLGKRGDTDLEQSYIYIYIQVSQEECARLREGVPYVKVYRYNPKHLCPKLNGYRDNGQRSLKI